MWVRLWLDWKCEMYEYLISTWCLPRVFLMSLDEQCTVIWADSIKLFEWQSLSCYLCLVNNCGIHFLCTQRHCPHFDQSMIVILMIHYNNSTNLRKLRLNCCTGVWRTGLDLRYCQRPAKQFHPHLLQLRAIEDAEMFPGSRGVDGTILPCTIWITNYTLWSQ